MAAKQDQQQEQQEQEREQEQEQQQQQQQQDQDQKQKQLSDEERFPYLFHQTEINPRTRTRNVEMKLLIIGMMRTGTTSMMAALEELGIKNPYHMNSCFLNPWDCDMWREAAEAKFQGKGEPYGRKEWDSLMSDSEACLDLPSAAFMPELIAAYPEAKVIIAQRDAAKWYTSVMATIAGKLSWTLAILTPFDPLFYGRWVPMLHALMTGLFGARPLADRATTLARYQALHDEVRALVPADRLLEFRLAEGWAPLCAFLGHEVPDRPFPCVNESAQFADRARLMQRMARRRALVNLAPYLGAMGVAAFGLWMGRGGWEGVAKILVSKIS